MKTKSKNLSERKMDRYADLLDTKFKIPGTNLRFGVDFLVGLVPGIGDVIGLVLSSGLVVAMVAKGASGRALAMMILNVALDTIIGAIPIIGDIWDFFFKANKRNLNLYQDHFEEGKHQGSARSVIIPVLIFLIVLIVGLIYGLVQLLQWIVS